MTAAKPPDTVLIEELTWAEVRDLVAAGTTNVIIGTAGTEQKGPHMVDGEHKFIMEYAADKIARGMGKTLVAPVDHLRARGQLGSAERPHALSRHDHAAGRSVRRAAGDGGPQPQGVGLQEHLLPRRVGRQSQRHARRGDAAERAVEGRRHRALGGRLLHEVARRSEQVDHREHEDPRGSDRRARQPARHLRAAVRRAEAHSPRSPDRQRLSEQRRQRRSGEVNAGARQGVPADQDRQHAGADQENVERRRAAGGGTASAGWRRWWPRRWRVVRRMRRRRQPVRP